MKDLIQEIADKYNVSVQFTKTGKLTKKSLKTLLDKVHWYTISWNHVLSEEFIREFQDKIDWYWISLYQVLSEDFIREFQNKVNWFVISKYKILSEEFIRELQDKVEWYWISKNQILSEEFIREFQNKVHWYHISCNKVLSEEFIREFQGKIDWNSISKYQVLSEELIREFQDKANWKCISKYQTLSHSFRKEFNLKITNTCWLYKSAKKKLEYIKTHTSYEIVDDKYVLAYKSVRKDMRSVFKPGMKYEVGKMYTSHCNCNIDEDNSFGLSAWTKDKAQEYHQGILLKVKIPIEKIGAVIHDNKKIRCYEQEIVGIV